MSESIKRTLTYLKAHISHNNSCHYISHTAAENNEDFMFLFPSIVG